LAEVVGRKRRVDETYVVLAAAVREVAGAGRDRDTALGGRGLHGGGGERRGELQPVEEATSRIAERDEVAAAIAQDLGAEIPTLAIEVLQHRDVRLVGAGLHVIEDDAMHER